MNWRTSQTPPALTLKRIHSFRSLNDPSLDVMCLVQNDSFPFILVKSRFVQFGHFSELVRNGAIRRDHHVISAQLLDYLVSFSCVVADDAHVLGMLADL